MNWSGVRAATAVGALALAAQGVLLVVAARGDGALALPWRWTLAGLSLLVVGAVVARRRERGAVPVLAATVVLAAALAGGAQKLAPPARVDAGATVEAASGAGTSRDGASPVDASIADSSLADLARKVAAWGDALVRDMADPALVRTGGAHFRFLAPLPSRWLEEEGADAPALAAAVWRDGVRVGWTRRIVPLAGEAPTAPMPENRLLAYRGQWYLQRLVPAPDGRLLELQLALPDPSVSWRGAHVVVEPSALRVEPGVLERDLDGDASTLTVRLRPSDGVVPAWSRARVMAALQGAWVLLILIAARRPGDGRALLAAAWIGRAFLASADLRRWLVASFPGVEYPTAPADWASLIDPAYFATPVAAGWFASTADALLSAALLAVTAWHLRRAAGTDDAAAESTPRWRFTPVAVVVGFGALAGGLLPAWRSLAMLMAENANARLIGPGVSLSFLTFWGLHVALLLVALATLFLLAAAATRAHRTVAMRLPWPLAAVAVAFVAAGVAIWPLRQALAGTWPVALLAAALWSAAALVGKAPAVRRAVWPVLLLVAALWNYAALLHVHERAERSWVERRAQQITEADPGWMRFLVQSVLVEMQEADQFAPAERPSGLWRDEAAWRLYRDSALFDLTYPGLVEILDDAEATESLFAAGFLRDFRYETLARSEWLTADGRPAEPGDAIAFQTERRLYSGGHEEILVAEVARRAGRGWLRVEVPLRSWRLSTLAPAAGDLGSPGGDRYRPRLEVDRPALLLLADDGGWRGSGPEGFPGAESDNVVAELRDGRREWAVLRVGQADWLCRWTALPPSAARAAGEGFLVGIRRATAVERLLDVSRLVLVDVMLMVGLTALLRVWRIRRGRGHQRWQPGFQEKFGAGYLALGLLLLLVVGVSVDRVGYDRVRAEARQQSREGLAMALQQLGGLLSDEARALADSGRLDDLADGSARAVGSVDPDLDRVSLFSDDGSLLFDGSAGLSGGDARDLLEAVRSAPVVIVRDDNELLALVAVPVALGGSRDASRGEGSDGGPGHGGVVNDGVLLLRQRLDGALVAGLAEILRGEVTVGFDGMPVLASHAEGLFAGERAALLDPGLMATLFDHPQGPGLASPPGRPFACDAAQPLPAFARDGDGRLVRSAAPAVLSVSFPGREREFAAQRRANVLFLAGLANLILLTALLLAALMSWSLFRPLRVLMGATRSLARGDFAAPLPPSGHDEVGRLSAAFDAMRGQLRHAQADLAARERFLATVLERVTVGVAVLGPDQEMVVVKPAGRDILGRFWPGTSAAEAAVRLHAGLAGQGLGGKAAGELVGGAGRLTLRGAVAPLDIAQPDGDRMIVFEDVSEFLATKKLALNAELARQVAHEIKNPLTPIQLSVQLLGQAWNDRHPQLDRIVPDTVDRVLAQVDLLRRIASEFSLLGRPDELPLAPVDLPALVARVTAAYQGAVGVEAAAAPTAGLAAGSVPPVMAHEESLLKILGNLMQNSLDAARPGVPPVIETQWQVNGDRVQLRWRDNGSGLPADVADRLFEPYFSTKSKGTGLGLAICRSLAERMGGNIGLANRVDGPGTEAVLELAAAGLTGVRG